jgi:hypothetical protein
VLLAGAAHCLERGTEDPRIGLAEPEHAGIGHGLEAGSQMKLIQAARQVAAEIRDHAQPVAGAAQGFQHHAIALDRRERVAMEVLHHRPEVGRARGQQRRQQRCLDVDGRAESKQAGAGEPCQGAIRVAERRLEHIEGERTAGFAIKSEEACRPGNAVTVEGAAEVE